jgi:Reverse transcriptase (RNA-dependent DNA polymerase).
MKQEISYCGVGAHQQNGIVERHIQDLTGSVQTMLVHAIKMYPEAVKPIVWPFALKAAKHARNKLKLDKSGLTPEERLTGVAFRKDVCHEHTLFCPVFVLDSRLQGNIWGIPKWAPRSNAGIDLGMSPHHASSAALVLNLQTGHVSPQFHVIFDDDFATVSYLCNDSEPPFWETLATQNLEHYGILDPRDDPSSLDFSRFLSSQLPETHPVSDKLYSRTNLADKVVQSQPDQVQEAIPQRQDLAPPLVQRRSCRVRRSNEHVCWADPVVPSTSEGERDPTCSNNMGEANVQQGQGAQTADDLMGEVNAPGQGAQTATSESTVQIANYVGEANALVQGAQTAVFDILDLTDAGLHRSHRKRSATAKLLLDPLNDKLKEALGYLSALVQPRTSAFFYPYFWYTSSSFWLGNGQDSMAWNARKQEALQLNFDGTLNSIQLLAHVANQGKNDVFTFREAMQQEDRAEFIKAMVQEIQDHTERGHWCLRRWCELGNVKTIKAVWSFKRKRKPGGTLIKHKARLCAHGGMQVYGEHYWDTYSPVVSWMSIRIMLTLSVIKN